MLLLRVLIAGALIVPGVMELAPAAPLLVPIYVALIWAVVTSSLFCVRRVGGGR